MVPNYHIAFQQDIQSMNHRTQGVGHMPDSSLEGNPCWLQCIVEVLFGIVGSLEEEQGVEEERNPMIRPNPINRITQICHLSLLI